MSSKIHLPSRTRRPGRKALATGLCVVASSLLGVGFVADASESSPAVGQVTSADVEVFAGIDPVRLLDTRSGVGATAAGPFAPGETRTLIATDLADVPANATSVAINVTLPGSATSTSFVTVWPSGTSQPATSTNNAKPGQAVPNFTVSALGSDGGVSVFNEAGDTHIVLDVVGYYVTLSSVQAAATPGGALISGQGAPLNSMGENGDFYIDEIVSELYKKVQDDWGEPMVSLDADAGPRVIAADGAPSSSEGDVDDVYFDTDALEVYGPKTASGWGTGQPLGPSGASGSSFLSGSGAPASGLGADGDLYLDADDAVLYGPKTAGAWGAGVDVGPDGGPDGVGSTLLTGSGVPGAGVGVDGDTYFDTSNAMFYGPKTAGAWGAGVDVGPDGVGSELITGSGAPDGGTGVDGDLYLDIATLELFGPKTGGAWPSGTDLNAGPVPSGSALSASNNASLIDLTVLGSTPLVFDTPEVSTGSAITQPDADTFELDAGVYEVSYSLSTVGVSLFGQNAQVQVNGVNVGDPIALAAVGVASTGVLLIEAPTDGSTLEIVTGGLLSVGVLNTSSIIIKQISAP